MAQLKEIRNRIASVKNTRQVTSAMKMVSAAKLKKAQDAIVQVAPYDNKLHEILQNLSLGEIKFESVFFNQPQISEVLIVVVGANRGLCGGFNSNVAKMAIQHAVTHYSDVVKAGNLKFLCVGKQVTREIKNRGGVVFEEANFLVDKPAYDETAKVASFLMDLFKEGSFHRIDVVYNKFKNAAVQLLTAEQYLPVSKVLERDVTGTIPDYIYEPSQEEVLTALIPKTLRMRLHRILLDSNAAENGARMTAMHQATDNATELLKELRTSYNNARQAAITNEIMEITAGAEALK
jgi:F-type H+-transporting ATPase subunit gamma